MNEIVNKFLLARDKFMPETHLEQPGFTYSACGPLLKTEKDLKNLCKQEIQIILIGMILMKLVSNMIWLKRTQSDKVLRDKAFKIASNPNYDDYQRGLASIVYKFFDKKSKGSGIKSMSNQQLVDQTS